jgi:hypothetical protein
VGKTEAKRLLGSLTHNSDGRHELNSCGSGQWPVAGSYEHGNETSDFIKCWQSHEQLSNSWILKGSAVWSSYIVQYPQRTCSYLLCEPQQFWIQNEIMAVLAYAACHSDINWCQKNLTSLLQDLQTTRSQSRDEAPGLSVAAGNKRVTQWQNNDYKRKKHFEECILQCHSVHHESYMKSPWLEHDETYPSLFRD